MVENGQVGGRNTWQLVRADLAVLATLAIVILVVRGAWFGDPNADIDEQLYSLIGLEMTRGAIPFVDLWDRKPIGLFALFALAHAIGGPDPIAYQLLAAMSVLAGAFMTYRLALRLVDRLTATGAGLLYALLTSIYSSHSGQTEAFHVPMMLGMALLVYDTAHPKARSRALVAMLIGGLALQVKYTVLPQCLFFGLWALWGQRRAGASLVELARLGAIFGLLGVLPTLLVALGYAWLGHFDEFIFANFVSFFDRLPAATGRFPPDHRIALLPIAGLLLASFYAAARLSRPRRPIIYTFFIMWFFATLGTVYLPSTIYQYYYAALAPVVALLAVPLLDRRTPVGIIPLVMVVGGFAYLSAPPTHYAFSQGQRAKIDRLGDAIRPRVDQSGNCLWVFDGPTALYRISDSCLPTSFIYPDHLNNQFERHALGMPQVAEVARILATHPPVIVTADTAFTPQNQEAKKLVWLTVQRDYEEIASERLHDRQIRVWARREPPTQ